MEGGLKEGVGSFGWIRSDSGLLLLALIEAEGFQQLKHPGIVGRLVLHFNIYNDHFSAFEITVQNLDEQRAKFA